MKRFMMALLFISAQAAFAADSGQPENIPLPPVSGCLMQLVGGVRVLADAARSNPTIAAALAAARAMADTVGAEEAAGNASAAERGEVRDDDADTDDESATPEGLTADSESAVRNAAFLKRIAALEAELAAIKAAAKTNADVCAALNQTA